jgi:hypothetical protein
VKNYSKKTKKQKVVSGWRWEMATCVRLSITTGSLRLYIYIYIGKILSTPTCSYSHVQKTTLGMCSYPFIILSMYTYLK